MSKRWRTPSKQNGTATCPKDKINASWRGNLLKPGSRLAAVRKEYRTGTQVGWLAFHRLWVTNGWICERFEPWSHFIRYLSLIVRANVVLNKTVVVDSDWRFDNLCGSHVQSQSELYHVSWWYYTLVIDLIGQLCRDVIGRLSVKPWCYRLWRLV